MDGTFSMLIQEVYAKAGVVMSAQPILSSAELVGMLAVSSSAAPFFGAANI